MLIVSAVIGLVIGHAIDLAFDRFFTGEPLGGPLYRCSECRSSLRQIHLIPLLGSALTGGRCPDCERRLPWRAVVLPAGCAVLFAVSYAIFDDFGAGLLAGFFCAVFLTLTLTDMERRLLPNRIVYPSILISIALSWAWPQSSVLEVLLGGGVAIALATGMFLFSLLFGEGAFGMGDVKMIVLIGFVVGFPAIIAAAFLGTISAGLVALILVVTRLRTMRDYIPHGPFLALGAVIALFASV